jgi:hypothetical protein
LYLLKGSGKTLDHSRLTVGGGSEMAMASLYVMLAYLARHGLGSRSYELSRVLAYNQRIVGPLQLRIIHAALDRYLIGGRPCLFPSLAVTVSDISCESACAAPGDSSARRLVVEGRAASAGAGRAPGLARRVSSPGRPEALLSRLRGARGGRRERLCPVTTRERPTPEALPSRLRGVRRGRERLCPSDRVPGAGLDLLGFRSEQATVIRRPIRELSPVDRGIFQHVTVYSAVLGEITAVGRFIPAGPVSRCASDWARRLLLQRTPPGDPTGRTLTGST